MYINLNGEFQKADASHISPMGEGFLYGYGLFETIKVAKGKMYFYQEHMKRFIRDSLKLNIKCNLNIANIESDCIELIEKNGLNNGAIRISCSKNHEAYYLLISTSQRVYREKDYRNGFNICFAKEKRNPQSLLVNIKSNNYLENIIVKNRAKAKGYDEAIFLNIYDKISEGAISNIFWVKNKEIYTPSIACGILPGIMRDHVIKIIENLGLRLYIGAFSKESLYSAEEVFLTNSLMDVMPVKKLEDIKLDIEKNTITRKIMEDTNKIYR